jgi:branched-chain amino acid aminotransferase
VKENDHYCFLNGSIILQSEATVSIFDIGMLRGYGVYEAMTYIHGNLFMFQDHMARFRISARFLKIHISYTDAEIEKIIMSLVEKNGYTYSDRLNIKFILTGGQAVGGIDFDRSKSSFYIFMEKWKSLPQSLYTDGASVLLHEHLRDYPQYKTTNYITAVSLQQKMKLAGALEALYTYKGNVLECATSNFFVVSAGNLLTPRENVLHGITRNVTVDLAQKQGIEVLERDITLEEVLNADECFLTSSFKDIVPVVSVGGKSISSGKVGEITRKMMTIFEQNLGAV